MRIFFGEFYNDLDAAGKKRINETAERVIGSPSPWDYLRSQDMKRFANGEISEKIFKFRESKNCRIIAAKLKDVRKDICGEFGYEKDDLVFLDWTGHDDQFKSGWYFSERLKTGKSIDLSREDQEKISRKVLSQKYVIKEYPVRLRHGNQNMDYWVPVLMNSQSEVVRGILSDWEAERSAGGRRAVIQMGPAGSGKTLLAVNLLTELQVRYQEDPSVRIGYFTRSHALRKSVRTQWKDILENRTKKAQTDSRVVFSEISEYGREILGDSVRGCCFTYPIFKNWKPLQDFLRRLGGKATADHVWNHIHGVILGSLGRDFHQDCKLPVRLVKINTAESKGCERWLKRAPHTANYYALDWTKRKEIKPREEWLLKYRQTEEFDKGKTTKGMLLQELSRFGRAYDEDSEEIINKQFMGKEEYLAQTEEEGGIPADVREEIYNFFLQTYWPAVYGENATYHDANVIARHLIHYWEEQDPGVAAESTKKFDYLVIDEVQDYTEVQIALLIRLLKQSAGGQVVFFGDEHQSIGHSNFDMVRLKGILGDYFHETGFVEKGLLETNFRNARVIAGAANSLATVRASVLGRSNAAQGNDIPANEAEGRLYRVTADMIRQESVVSKIIASPDAIILVTSEKQKEQATDFLQGLLVKDEDSLLRKPEEAIELVEDIKGIEFKYVLFYNAISEQHASWERILKQYDPQRRVFTGEKESCAKYGLLFDRLYVGITRAQRTLCFFDEYGCDDVYKKLSWQLDLKNGQEGEVELGLSELEFDYAKKAEEYLQQENYSRAARYFTYAGSDYVWYRQYAELLDDDEKGRTDEDWFWKACLLYMPQEGEGDTCRYRDMLEETISRVVQYAKGDFQREAWSLLSGKCLVGKKMSEILALGVRACRRMQKNEALSEGQRLQLLKGIMEALEAAESKSMVI